MSKIYANFKHKGTEHGEQQKMPWYVQTKKQT
jgi:hypothetical protein